MTEAEFRDLCMVHDLTYSYSDDAGTWRRGREEYAQIMEAAKQFDPETSKRIWNEVVDYKLMPEYATQYYWV